LCLYTFKSTVESRGIDSTADQWLFRSRLPHASTCAYHPFYGPATKNPLRPSSSLAPIE
jgi:hypothetical protein